MAILENGDKMYTVLITEIETGQVKIPQFQRQFVWDMPASAKLIDSILKGYPIGTFIYWRTNERLRSIRNIGEIQLPEPRDGEFINYVLDGQQRITSLFAALKGEKIVRDNGKIEDFSHIYIDLEAGEDDNLCIIDISQKDPLKIIKLHDLMYERGKLIYNRYDENLHTKIDTYKETLQSYQFKGINLKEAEIDVATEVFTRLNVGGKDLTLFEIMVAKTFDQASGFDLFEKFEELKSELEPSKYDTISSANVLQLISLLLTQECKRKTILKLEKADFIAIWEPAVESIKRAIDFFRGYGIPVSGLLPYNALVVPFSYFFFKHPNNPTGQTFKLLEDFFWRVSLGFRYSSSVEGKLVQDVDKIDKILKGEQPRYEWLVDTSAGYIKQHGYFTTGKSFVKAILSLYAMHSPKRFDNGLLVTIDNSWLIRANSKNYHHFFPKAYMRNNFPEWEDWKVNHIINITIIDGYLNKNVIKAKAPAEYMHKFLSKNPKVDHLMESHLIDNMDTFGVWENDYKKFFDERSELISKKLTEKIIQQIDTDGPLEVYEDIEETEEVEL